MLISCIDHYADLFQFTGFYFHLNRRVGFKFSYIDFFGFIAQVKNLQYRILLDINELKHPIFVGKDRAICPFNLYSCLWQGRAVFIQHGSFHINGVDITHHPF
ncbi:hypothetical protein D3C85_1088510 [compost metagenome]